MSKKIKKLLIVIIVLVLLVAAYFVITKFVIKNVNQQMKKVII